MNENKKYAGVVGDPISHSLSPFLHEFWLKKYGINGSYSAFHVTSSELPEFLKNLKKSGLNGVNLTVPHKELALELVDIVEPIAEKIGAVNTVYFNDEGKLVGTNTDGYGFLKHLKQSIPNWISNDKTALVLGAGGAARAVVVSLLEDGIGSIQICNRTLSRATSLANELDDERISVIEWDNYLNSLASTDILVNVTTLGMTGQHPLDIDIGSLPVDATVYDIVYNPLETNLLKRARARGNSTVDGLGMLLHQAAPGFEKWFGVMPEVDNDLALHLLEKLK